MSSIDSTPRGLGLSEQLEVELSALTVAEPPIEPDLMPQANSELMLSEPSTVMLTGAGGLLGRSMDAQLSRSGWRVIALPRTELDITDESAVRSAIELFR